ncbi:hypothetical protein CDL15_Pgr008427 [Punica granatum]|uniref:NAD(P)-binding domain-containing protein n=1 Tax=Punica granatum TaxID=22663 RepID=A0A218WN95_PUNGR|nr:hypothetical protein CDL15_Pgr008427 [Punica granatum]
MEATAAARLCPAPRHSLFAPRPRHGARSIRLPSLLRNPNLNAGPAHSPSTRFRVPSSSAAGAKLAEEASSSSGFVGESDLLIVGPGVLGRLVAEKWRKEYPSCQIYGQTVTMDHHNELIQMGISPLLKGSETAHKVPYVIFCAPPSRSPDYPGDLRVAASNWNGEGAFLFTSSSALYDCNDNGPCNEDAASLAVAILKKKLHSRIFLGCDNHPVTRQEVMDSIAKNGKFNKQFDGFTGTDGPLGKRLNNSRTREEIGWQPRYSSFSEFLGVSQ